MPQSRQDRSIPYQVSSCFIRNTQTNCLTPSKQMDMNPQTGRYQNICLVFDQAAYYYDKESIDVPDVKVSADYIINDSDQRNAEKSIHIT